MNTVPAHPSHVVPRARKDAPDPEYAACRR
jgi:hypothetical protein